MKKYLALILALTALLAAVASYAKEIKRMAAEKPSVAVTPTAKSYLLASYSTATEWDIRRVADTSVLKLGGIDTTAPDGARYINPGNSTTCPAEGPDQAICTLPTGVYWYGTVNGIKGWHSVALTSTTPPPKTGYVTTPLNSNSTCTVGQWSIGSGYHYDCVATDTWDRFAYAGWSSPGTSVATINYDRGAASTMASFNTTSNIFFYTQVQPSSTGKVNYAHYDAYSNSSNTRFAIYSLSGTTATIIPGCSGALNAGSGGAPQPFDEQLAGTCNLTAGNNYLVGVWVQADGTGYNGVYVAGIVRPSYYKTVAAFGDSFDTSTASQLSGTRTIFAWGDNSATR